MRLSSAIRLGSTLGPQAFGVYKKGDALCAVGAAYSAVGRLYTRDDITFCYPPVFAWESGECKCPCDGCPFDWVWGRTGIAMHLNDRHHWTRAKIADYIETIEPVEVSECEQVEKVEVRELVPA